MARNTPNTDEQSNNVKKLDKKKNSNGKMEASEEFMLFAGGTERDMIRRRNAQRMESIEGMRRAILDEGRARASQNGLFDE